MAICESVPVHLARKSDELAAIRFAVVFLIVVFASALPGCAIFFPGEPPFILVSEASKAPGAYARSTVYGGRLFTAGVFPSDRFTGGVMRGDITAQTHRVFDDLELILSGAGCTMMDLVKVDIHVVNSADLEKMNDVIAARLGGNRQVRTTLSAAKLAGPALLEVDIVARIPQ